MPTEDNNLRTLAPFHVRTAKGNNLTEGYVKESDAQADAKDRNARASELGLSESYEVVPNPDFDQALYDKAKANIRGNK